MRTMKCERCKKTTNATRMSMFNTQTCCLECIEEERMHKDYEKARIAELEEVKKGNYCFDGIGLPKDLEEKYK